MNEVNASLAFLSGLASFLSPCVLPLVPIYLSILTGVGYHDLVKASETKDRRIMIRLMLYATAFVLGFSLAFILMGAAASQIGQWLQDYREWFVRGGGIFVILFGLYFLGVFRFKWLNIEKQIDWKPSSTNFFSSALMGFVFAFAWTPCVSYTLSGIFLLAADSAHLSEGMFLLAIYSAGLGIPFLLTAAAFSYMSRFLGKAKKYLPVFEKAMGILLILIGILLVSGVMRTLTFKLSRFSFFS